MLRLGEDGGIGLFLIFQERSRSYLQAQATRIREGYRLAAFNAGMIMGSLDIGGPCPQTRVRREAPTETKGCR
jgi:hypothetical protein